MHLVKAFGVQTIDRFPVHQPVKLTLTAVGLQQQKQVYRKIDSAADMFYDNIRRLVEQEEARDEADRRTEQKMRDQDLQCLHNIMDQQLLTRCHRLDQANIVSPFDGVVVEGDLRERLGAHVKQGDALSKIARIDTLYVEAEVQ